MREIICSLCGGEGEKCVERHATREMALDAEDRSLEGVPVETCEPCGNCGGNGVIDVDAAALTAASEASSSSARTARPESEKENGR